MAPTVAASVIAERRKAMKKKKIAQRKARGEVLVAEVMRKYDKDHSGGLSVDELSTLLTDLNKGQRPSPEEVNWLLHTADPTNTSKIIHVDELRAAIHEYLIYQHSLPRIDKVYKKYNTTRTGRLNRKELRAVLSDISGREITDDVLDWVFEHADTSNPGEVAKFEYLGVIELWHANMVEEDEPQTCCVIL